jgi:hypothetical protein
VQTQALIRIRSYLTDLLILTAKHAKAALAKSQKARKAPHLFPCITYTGRKRRSFGRYSENRMIQLLPNCDTIDA